MAERVQNRATQQVGDLRYWGSVFAEVKYDGDTAPTVVACSLLDKLDAQ